MDRDLVSYYSERAPEYDEIYAKPERQADLASLKEHLRALLRGHFVLEIAAGTGYWTEVTAEVAESVLATDLSREALALARGRSYGSARVELALADAYDLAGVAGEFTAGLAGFFWSHVPRQQLTAFLDGFHRRLGPGSRVVFFDNRYVPGSSTEISHFDDAGNSYQERRLKDGSRRTVLKNFPTRDELESALAGKARGGVEIALWRYYWCVTYQVR